MIRNTNTVIFNNIKFKDINNARWQNISSKKKKAYILLVIFLTIASLPWISYQRNCSIQKPNQIEMKHK